MHATWPKTNADMWRKKIEDNRRRDRDTDRRLKKEGWSVVRIWEHENAEVVLTRSYRSGGIRLKYDPLTDPVPDLKEGVLLEAGFDDVTPNVPKDITSWAYQRAVAQGVDLIDNRAMAVACYLPGYTLVEKLQTVSTKFRKQQETGESPMAFMRHYTDVYSLLNQGDVQDFIGSDEYRTHKARRFRSGDEPDITKNQAFVLSDAGVRALYEKAYGETSALYYRGRPAFDEILKRIAANASRL